MLTEKSTICGTRRNCIWVRRKLQAASGTAKGYILQLCTFTFSTVILAFCLAKFIGRSSFMFVVHPTVTFCKIVSYKTLGDPWICIHWARMELLWRKLTWSQPDPICYVTRSLSAFHSVLYCLKLPCALVLADVIIWWMWNKGSCPC